MNRLWSPRTIEIDGWTGIVSVLAGTVFKNFESVENDPFLSDMLFSLDSISEKLDAIVRDKKAVDQDTMCSLLIDRRCHQVVLARGPEESSSLSASR
jgi:hypothetical protein